MICPSCSHENVEGAKFCNDCGTPLATPCPNCSSANPPGSRFCNECGTPLTSGAAAAPASPATTTAPSAPSKAERRLVSVLFADLVGFTTYSESRDPEEVREMLTRYFDRSQEVVARFRGTIDKFIGDAVMAWWGAVEANEDDAERAVRAALELVDMVTSLGEEIGVPELALRAGVLTGETSVGPGGNEQGLIVGDLVNTASRLQSIAEPGTVVVGESTRNLVLGAVEFETLDEQKVKGKEIPVKPYRALRVVAQRGGKGRAEGIEPPFTGRHEELRLLKDQLHGAGREERARLVSIVGEGGIGKSRLAWELLKYIDGIAEVVYWHHGRSPAYGDGIALWSLAEMVRGRAGIAAETEDRAKSRLKLRTAVAEHVPSEEERRWVEPRLAGLLGLEEMPPGDRDELFAAVRTFFQRIAEKGTVVMVFEDLHWADDGVLEFITDLVERSTRHPILVLTLGRPELLERHPGWGSGRRNTLSMHVAPLADTDMHDLVVGMVPGIPEDAVSAIVGRAAGIPLYAVEFVRMLLAGGDLTRDGDAFALSGELSDLAVPDSLAAVIGARLDRLDPDDRALVQDAAVLGQSFTLQGLAAVRGVEAGTLEEPLRSLARQELFEYDDDPRSAERGQYRFVQSLIREVAYGRLSLADRHSRHLAVAEYFAGLDEPEVAGIVASHYLSAHETAPAGTDDLLERGRSSLVEAARRNAALQANAQALNLYRQALEITTGTAERAETLVAAARVAGAAGEMDAAVDLGRDAIAAMSEVGDTEGTLRANVALADVFNSFFRSGEAMALLEPVYQTVETFEAAAPAELGLEMARAYMLSAKPDKSLEVAERVLPHAERLASTDAVLDGVITKATALAVLGRSIEAESALVGAVALAEKHELLAQSIRALNNLAVVQSSVDPMASTETGEHLYELTLRVAGAAWVERTRYSRAAWLMLSGQFGEAVEMLDAIDVAHISELERMTMPTSRLVIQGFTDAAPGAGEALRTEIDGFGEVSDHQFRAEIEGLRVWSHLFDGDWDQVFESAVRTEVPWNPWIVALSATAAVRMADAGKLQRAMEAISAQVPSNGRLGVALRTIGAGAAAVLAGDLEQGAAAMQAGIDLLAKVGLPIGIADWRTAFATLVGLDHPAGLAAGTLAREWIDQTGAYGLGRVWAAGLPVEAPPVEKTG